MDQLVVDPVAEAYGRKRSRPRRINKVRSISARCKGCGELLVLRMEWSPGPLHEFASEILENLGTCPQCERALEMPDLKDVKLTLAREDD